MRPFSEGDTYPTLRNIIEKIVAEINGFDNAYVLKASPTELEQYCVGKSLLEPLVLRVDDRQIEDSEGIDVDVSRDFRRGIFAGERATVRGTRLTVVIPFDGDPMLWRLRASTFSMSGYPDIAIRDGAISFGIEFPDDTANADQIRQRIDRDTKALADGVGYLKNDVDQHNRTAPDTIRQALDRKRKQAESTAGVLAKLGIPIQRKAEAPAFALPVKRRASPTQRPPVAAGKQESDDPFLDEKEYEHILKILRSMSLVIERDPTVFATFDEESIRTLFLLQLNGHYEGGATGETFNLSGKTDILIRAGDRNVFIAECKFWRGPKGFNDAIDQLLSYLTWRDTKSALLVFNTTKDSSGVRAKMHDVILARPEYRKTIVHNADGDSRYVLIKPSEPGKDIIVTTQLYDVPGKN